MRKFLYHVIVEELFRWHWYLVRLHRSKGGKTPLFEFSTFDWTTDGYWDIDGWWLLGFNFLGRSLRIIEGVDDD